MRNHRVYIKEALSTDITVPLDKDALHYVGTVLRLKNNTRVTIFNGDGHEYLAELNITKRSGELKILELSRTATKNPHSVHLLQAIARGDHMDYAIQKATELNVDEITPILTERTQGHDAKRLEKRFQHWQNIIIHACEQSGRCWLPRLNPVTSYADAIEQTKSDIKLICHFGETQLPCLKSASSIAALIGPEGGLTEDEVTTALSAEFNAVSLGANVLRTETAASSIVTLIQYQLQ